MNAPRYTRCQDGVAAVELALVLFSASVLLASLLFCARLGWHAIVLHRAMYSAALMMADTSPEQLMDSAATAQAMANARGVVADLLQGAGVTTPINPMNIGIECDRNVCASLTQPQSFRLIMSMPVAADGVGDGLVQYMLGSSSATIITDDTVSYAP
jgi:Flp pilus assembly protein TadG